MQRFHGLRVFGTPGSGRPRVIAAVTALALAVLAAAGTAATNGTKCGASPPAPATTAARPTRAEDRADR